MATSRIAAAALQFSKWLSRTITWFWMIYRMVALILSAIVPASAVAIASTLANLDLIMMINEGTYLVNSLGEKYIYSDKIILKWLEKGGWKSIVQKITNGGISSDESDEETKG